MTRTFFLVNDGTADGVFSLDASSLPSLLSLTVATGTVRPKEELEIEVLYVHIFWEHCFIAINRNTGDFVH